MVPITKGFDISQAILLLYFEKPYLEVLGGPQRTREGTWSSYIQDKSSRSLSYFHIHTFIFYIFTYHISTALYLLMIWGLHLVGFGVAASRSPHFMQYHGSSLGNMQLSCLYLHDPALFIFIKIMCVCEFM